MLSMAGQGQLFAPGPSTGPNATLTSPVGRMTFFSFPILGLWRNASTVGVPEAPSLRGLLRFPYPPLTFSRGELFHPSVAF